MMQRYTRETPIEEIKKMQGYIFRSALRPRVLAGVVAVAGLGLGLAGCGGGSEAAEGAREEVAVALGPRDVSEALRSDLTAGVALTGSLDPYRVVNVFAQVPGTINGLNFDRGDHVSRGAILASIEAEGIRGYASGAEAAVAAAQAGLAPAERQLESAQILFEARSEERRVGKKCESRRRATSRTEQRQ